MIDHNDALLGRARCEFPSDIEVRANAEIRGLSGSRNTGVGLAKGDIVAFLDDDAEADPGWLEELLAQYLPGVVGAGGVAMPVWPADKRPRWFPTEFDWVVGCSYRGLPDAVAPQRNPIGAAMSFRRSVFIEVGSFDTAMGRLGSIPLGCEETEFSIRVRRTLVGSELVHVPLAVVHHHVSSERTTLRYFLRRCYAEGLSKSAVTQRAGSEQALSSERTYVRSTLPRGVLDGLRGGLRGDPAGFTRSAMICVGLLATIAGYLTPRSRGDHRRSTDGPTDKARAGRRVDLSDTAPDEAWTSGPEHASATTDAAGEPADELHTTGAAKAGATSDPTGTTEPTDETESTETRETTERKRLFSTFGFLVSKQGATAVIGLVYWSVATHLFRARDVGLAASASSTAFFLAAIGVLGIAVLLLAELGSVDEPKRRAVFSTGMAVACSVVLVLSIGTMALSPVLGKSLRIIGLDPVTAVLFVVGGVATVATITFDNAAIGLNRGSAQLTRGIVASVLKLACVGLLVLVGSRTSAGLILSWVAGLVISLAVCFPMLRLGHAPAGEGSFSQRRELVRRYGMLSLNHHALNLSINSVSFIIPAMAALLIIPQQVAYFITADLIATTILIIPYLLALASSPLSRVTPTCCTGCCAARFPSGSPRADSSCSWSNSSLLRSFGSSAPPMRSTGARRCGSSSSSAPLTSSRTTTSRSAELRDASATPQR